MTNPKLCGEHPSCDRWFSGAALVNALGSGVEADGIDGCSLKGLGAVDLVGNFSRDYFGSLIALGRDGRSAQESLSFCCLAFANSAQLIGR